MPQELTPRERASLAEQILANPLFGVVMADMERRATETLIYAPDDLSRLNAALRVQAIRNFGADLRATLSTQPPKSAPA